MPSIIELYDGESRTKLWWKIVRRHSAVLAVLFSLPAVAWLGAASGGGIGVEGLLGLGVILVLLSSVVWLILLAFSMAAPRVAFAAFYWNGWLIGLLFLPATVGAALLASSSSVLAWVFFIGLLGSAIAIKTVLLYRRFSIAASERGRQQLPT